MTNELEKYEQSAKEYPQNKLLTGYHHLLRLNTVLKFLKKTPKNSLIIDCGCGDGVQAEIIGKSNTVIGIELSPTRARRAKKRGVDVVIADLNYIPFKCHIFDVALLGGVIEHLVTPTSTLSEINRILKFSGYLINDAPSKSNILDMIIHPVCILFKPILKRISINTIEKNLYDKIFNWGLYMEPTHVTFYNMSSINKILNKSGFNIIDVRGAPCLRYDFPSIIHPTLFKIIDVGLCRLPIIKKYGAIQVFMSQKVME